jgi:hypothetical protein
VHCLALFKSEIRSPKPEGNPKAEIRTGLRYERVIESVEWTHLSLHGGHFLRVMRVEKRVLLRGYCKKWRVLSKAGEAALGVIWMLGNVEQSRG